MAIAVATLFFLPAEVGAAGLTVKNPKKLVHLSTASGGDCSGGINSVGKLIDTRVVDNGGPSVSLTSFSIPSGKIFIMTQAQLSSTGADPGDSVQFRLFRSQGAGGGTEYVRQFVTSNSDGHASLTVNFPTGVAMKSLENFCAQTFSSSAAAIQGVIHGFLVKD
jgi:hypothetical protein